MEELARAGNETMEELQVAPPRINVRDAMCKRVCVQCVSMPMHRLEPFG